MMQKYRMITGLNKTNCHFQSDLIKMKEISNAIQTVLTFGYKLQVVQLTHLHASPRKPHKT